MFVWHKSATKMQSLILFILVLPYSYGFQMREIEYECGAHGRFEYCIDGVPGCVIGCHCHPGYYFDTDTKICEPNIKLSQNFRRNYEMLEPTRMYISQTPQVIEEPATTVQSAVDEKIDVITKDADDLGDWLYNQFFKTIENQVINETKDDSIITRRSDSGPTFIRKPTRRSHRYWRARRKKKKKKKGLKSKLLRITEDDSLFDSSSSSTSDESSGSSSSSSSEDTREATKEKKTKSDHGHKKIVVFNKRPKPPLPSFIFLPNMETPFFPPIGLPPPPMPMYPMVPVPPMMPFSFPVPTPCDTQANKTNGNAGAQPSQTDKTSQPSEKPPDNNAPKEDSSGNKLPTSNPDSKSPKENPTDDQPPNENPADDNPPDENPPDPVPPDENSPDDQPPDENPPSLLRARTKKRRGPRNKLIQKLRDKMKRKNKLEKYLANEHQGPPIVPPGFVLNHLPNMRHRPLPEINVEEELAALQDVDFKYLSQLIHRADLNKTNHKLLTTITAPVKNVLTVPPPSRRSYYDSYSDQITQVLSNLANQPMNHNPENQSVYETPQQHTYNAANQPSYSVPNQPTYNVPNQPTYNVPNQPTYNDPNKPTYNVPNQPTYNVPNQSIYNVPPTYNSANQPNHNTPNQLNNNLPNQHTYKNKQPTHVSLNEASHKIPYRKKIEDTNDFYYANLGRQIASMIRNIEGDKEVDIEIKSSPNIPNNSVLTGHTGSRSFWERSVRSPYKHIMNSIRKEIDNLRLSNEDLFSLENKVEIAASTEPTLSLHELENIISKMHKAKSKLIHSLSSRRAAQSSKSSFKFNLLPTSNQQFHSNGKINKRAQNIPAEIYKPNNSMNDTNIIRQVMRSPLQPSPIRSSFLTDFMFTLQASDEHLNETTPNLNTYQANAYVPAISPTRKPAPVAAPQFRYKMTNPHFKSYAYTVRPLPPKSLPIPNMQPPYMQTTTSRTYYQQLSPMVLNHRSIKYYDRTDNNQYSYDKASIPLRPPQSFPSNRIAPASRYDNFGKTSEPSYFHHEVHHFDYFDDLL